MSLRPYGRAFERTFLRPVFRRFRRPRPDNAALDARLAELAARIDRLESLFREQAGLQYLRIFDGREIHDPVRSGEAGRPLRSRDTA